MIINGYAFTQIEDGVRVRNLNRPTSAAALSLGGEVWEMAMDDIELGIVQDYYACNKQYLVA